MFSVKPFLTSGVFSFSHPISSNLCRMTMCSNQYDCGWERERGGGGGGEKKGGREREIKEKKYCEWVTGTHCSDRCWIQWIPSGGRDGITDTKECEMIRIKHTRTSGTSKECEGRTNNGKQCQQLLSAKLKKRHCPQGFVREALTVCLTKLCGKENSLVSFFLSFIHYIFIHFKIEK